MSNWNELRSTPTRFRDFAEHIRAALDPDLECRDDYFTFTFDPRTHRIFLERGEPKTASHQVFRITLDPDAAVDPTFQLLRPEHILRLDVLRNAKRIFEKRAINERWNALQAGKKPRVTQAEWMQLTRLPAEAFHAMQQDGGPEVYLDESGIPYVRGPELLVWFDRLPQLNTERRWQV